MKKLMYYITIIVIVFTIYFIYKETIKKHEICSTLQYNSDYSNYVKSYDNKYEIMKMYVLNYIVDMSHITQFENDLILLNMLREKLKYIHISNTCEWIQAFNLANDVFLYKNDIFNNLPRKIKTLQSYVCDFEKYNIIS